MFTSIVIFISKPLVVPSLSFYSLAVYRTPVHFVFKSRLIFMTWAFVFAKFAFVSTSSMSMTILGFIDPGRVSLVLPLVGCF